MKANISSLVLIRNRVITSRGSGKGTRKVQVKLERETQALRTRSAIQKDNVIDEGENPVRRHPGVSNGPFCPGISVRPTPELTFFSPLPSKVLTSIIMM